MVAPPSLGDEKTVYIADAVMERTRNEGLEDLGFSLNSTTLEPWTNHLPELCFYGCKTAKILQESAPSCFSWQESSYLQKSAHIFKMLLKCESVPRIFEFEG